ncbi:MAG: IPExxxVDY family protein [Chitinophagaceae bacterium]|nr:IPExxxVDY family protein [Chitinophagaceae bacterium]
MKLQLDTDEMIDAFFENTKILGIVAPMEPYKFCWNLNTKLNYDFRTSHDLEIQMRKNNRNYYFTIYEYKIPAGKMSHFLYNNRYDGEFLLPELKHFDFIWLMKYEEHIPEKIASIIEAIRSIPVLQIVTELSLDKIKSRGNLCF